MAIKEELLLKGKADFKEVDREAKRAQKSLGDMARGFGDAMTRVNQALEVAQTALHALGQGVAMARFTGQVERLEAVVGEGLASRLKSATGDTITSFDAMSVAAKAMQADFKFTGDEMEDVFAFAKKLSDSGFGPLKETTDTLFNALITGGEELIKFGINLEGATTVAEKTQVALRQLHEMSKNPLAVGEAANEFDKFNAELEDMIDDLKFFVGAAVREVFLFLKSVSPAFKLIADLRGKQRKILEEQDRKARAAKDAQIRRSRIKVEVEPTVFLEDGELFEEVEDFTINQVDAFNKEIANKIKSRPPLTLEQKFKMMFTADDAERDFQAMLSKVNESLVAEGAGLQPIIDAEMIATNARIDADVAFTNATFEQAEERKSIREQEVAAQMAAFEAQFGAARAGIGLAQEIFGKSKAVRVANAGLHVLEEIAHASSQFALFNVPGGVAHLFAAAKWGLIAGKSAAGGGGSSTGRSTSRGGAGGGLSRPSGGGGSGRAAPPMVININGPSLGAPEKLGEVINRAIRVSERRGTTQPVENRVVTHA